jgi:hypothetical protein
MGWNIFWMSIHIYIRISKFPKYFLSKFIWQENGFYFWQFRHAWIKEVYSFTVIVQRLLLRTINVQKLYNSRLSSNNCSCHFLVDNILCIICIKKYSLKNSMIIVGKILWDCRKYDCSIWKDLAPKWGARYLLTEGLALCNNWSS